MDNACIALCHDNDICGMVGSGLTLKKYSEYGIVDYGMFRHYPCGAIKGS